MTDNPGNKRKNAELIRARRLQARINSALRESPEERASTSFSPYLEDAGFGVENALAQAAQASGGGYSGVEAALDEFDRLVGSEGVDLVRAQYGLQLFLTHDSELAGLGLRLPSLLERAPWKIKPSKEEPK